MTSIQEITGAQSNAGFRKRLFRLLTLYRRNLDLDATAPRSQNVREELLVLRKELVKVGKLLLADGEGLSAYARRILHELIIQQNRWPDPIADLTDAVGKASDLIEEALKGEALRLKGGTGRHVEEWRQLTIEELARAFDDELSIKPSKTKNGVFDQCLKTFMAAVSCTVDGRQITARFPSNTFPLIAKALDTYPTKPINPLLTQQWPGL